MLETLDDIVEELADKFGIYGTGSSVGIYGGHDSDCKCRICYCGWMKNRIERAAEVERKLR